MKRNHTRLLNKHTDLDAYMHIRTYNNTGTYIQTVYEIKSRVSYVYCISKPDLSPQLSTVTHSAISHDYQPLIPMPVWDKGWANSQLCIQS